MVLSTSARALLGGSLIGASAVLLMALSGRIAGISGMAEQLTRWPLGFRDRVESAAFVLGLLLAPWMFAAAMGARPLAPATGGIPSMAVAGILVGFGAMLGNGCTSGHGVCGIARLSVRSLVAVPVFMFTAILIVALHRALVGLP